ncbi:MAG: hypothetical protein IJH91_06750 [Mogibacterium sp.]|nr:hypothetical protein [Mogibacterium sp.]
MMNNASYRARNAKKIKDYIEAGMIPGYDVIFTFDYDGTINAYDIEQQLKLWINSPMNVNVDLRFQPLSDELFSLV